MKTVIYTVFFSITFSFMLFSCSNENEQEKTLRQTYIDVSDFTMYKGSPSGGVKVQFNNLKKKELIEKYLSEVFNPDAYKSITLQFNENKLTYLESASGNRGKQIISDYVIDKEGLHIMVFDSVTNTKNPKFIALVDVNSNFYLRSGLIGYTNPKFSPEQTDEPTEPRFKQDSLNTVVDIQTVLNRLGYSSIEELTNPTDTIVWCNVIYPFN